MGSFIVTKESLHYSLNCELTQVASVKHGTGVSYLMPVDVKYTDINFVGHSHLLTTFNLMLS